MSMFFKLVSRLFHTCRFKVLHTFYLHRISKEEIQPFLEQMLSNLLNLLQVPGSQENEYVMKGKAFNAVFETKFKFVKA